MKTNTDPATQPKRLYWGLGDSRIRRGVIITRISWGWHVADIVGTGRLTARGDTQTGALQLLREIKRREKARIA